MLKLTRMVPQTREFDQWFEEVREMMHREVSYDIEAATTRRFAERLKAIHVMLFLKLSTATVPVKSYA